MAERDDSYLNETSEMIATSGPCYKEHTFR